MQHSNNKICYTITSNVNDILYQTLYRDVLRPKWNALNGTV